MLEHCDTRCAQDQKNGVRGWPLGSSDYETSCYKFREIAWCLDTGGTPEQFQTVERARLEGQAKSQKTAARREQQPKKMAVSSAQEQFLFPKDQQLAPPPAPVPAHEKVERPKMF